MPTDWQAGVFSCNAVSVKALRESQIGLFQAPKLGQLQGDAQLSTARRMGVTFLKSGNFECDVDRLEQCIFTKRLGEECCGACPDRLLADFRVNVGGDINDWNAPALTDEAAMQFQSAHPRHFDIEKNAPGQRQERGLKKLFGGGESFGSKPVGSEEAAGRITDRFVIIHNRHQLGRFFFHHPKASAYPIALAIILWYGAVNQKAHRDQIGCWQPALQV